MSQKTSLFLDLERAEHVYLLGLIASGEVSNEGNYSLEVQGNAPFATNILVALGFECRNNLLLADDILKKDIYALLQVTSAWECRRKPDLSGDLEKEFWRGLFDQWGVVSRPDASELKVAMRRQPELLENDFLAFVGSVPQKVGRARITWQGVAALDLLGHLFERSTIPVSVFMARGKHARRYQCWCSQMDRISGCRVSEGRIEVQRLRDDAVLPQKTRISDSGYDLSLLYLKKQMGNVLLFGTGIVVSPPQGWYFDLIPRSSIVKRGYILANSVGVIDRSYRGEICVPLIKVDQDAEDLQLPARLVQLIPRPIVHFDIFEPPRLDATHRGVGGFGSSGA